MKVYEYPAYRPPKQKTGTVAALITEFKRSPDWMVYAPKTKAQYLQAFDIIYKWRDIPVESIKRRNLLQIRDAMRDTPGKANVFTNRIARLFAFALDREYVEYNPFVKIKPLAGGEHARWPEAVVDWAITPGNLAESHRRAVVLALYTGQREGDVVKMRWADIEQGGVNVTQQKGGARVWIPLHSDLRAELDTWSRDALTILVNTRGRPWDVRSFANAFSSATRRYSMLNGYVYHGLRKSAASRLAEAGCTEHEIMAITGHKSVSEVQRYTREVRQRRTASAAIVKLENAKFGPASD